VSGLPDIQLEHVLELPDGRCVEWEFTGEGEPMIWIEGGPGLWAHLGRPDVALLADGFRCHLVNAPGCGRTSPDSSTGYDLASHVRFFDDVRAALGYETVTLVGHSWGGLVAVASAIAHPEHVRGLIVVDGYAGDASVLEADADAEREAAFDRVRDREWFEDAVAAILETMPTEAAEVERFRAAWPLYFAHPESEAAVHHVERLRGELRWNMDALRAWEPEPPIDLRPQLERVVCPTLVIAGEHDFICGPSWNRPIAEGIPGARLAIVPDVGHMPQYEAPDEFRRIVDSWLAGRS
jgi:proline iminopeptidase